MTLTFYWEPSLYSFFFTALIIFKNIALILYARSRKKTEDRLKYTNLLLVLGIIRLIYTVISFFLPGIRLSYFSPLSEYFMFYFIVILYNLPLILEVFFGVVLLLHFSNYQRDKKALVGPILFIDAIMNILIFNISSNYIYVFERFLYNETYGLYLMVHLIFRSILVVGLLFIFLYSIKLNKDFLIMFCGIFLGVELAYFFNVLNAVIIEFTIFW